MRYLFLSSLVFFCLVCTGHAQEYAGAEKCAGCHASEYRDWLGSHHQLAMARASDDSVLGDFDHAEFTYAGVTSTFYRKGDAFWVRTADSKGKLKDFQISDTFGVYPLQQYMVDFPDGRKQVLNIAWDARPETAGGQRWYQLLPTDQSLAHGQNEGRQPADADQPLPWTGTYYNWNSRCASCHSTNLTQGYDPKTNRYHTRYSEISVGCESCHGPGEKHLEWAGADDKGGYTNKGLTVSLADTAEWAFTGHKPPISDIKRRIGPVNNRQIEVCAHCHSRRQELTQWQPDKPFADQALMRLLRSDLYHADGQMIDENYVYGSFLQSKMHRNGVVCSNCHNPHSLKLKFPGNRTCTQCHKATVFDTPKHYHHPAGSAGSRCVNCHMPAVTYMGVDARRDHSFRLPRPMLEKKVGSPNVCLDCHQGRTNRWAQKAIDQWGLAPLQPADDAHFANAFMHADRGTATSSDALVQIADNGALPAIVRGSAALRLAAVPDKGAIRALPGLLDNDAWLIRLGAVKATADLPLALRWRLLRPHLDEPIRAVRYEIARGLAGVPLDKLAKADRVRLHTLFGEFLDSLAFNAGMPGSRLTEGVFHVQRGDAKAAEQDYRAALELAPDSEGALLNLADLYRATGRDAKAGPLLQRAVKIHPESGAANYALGLWWVRQHDNHKALAHLASARELAPDNPGYVLANGLILEKLGRKQAAITLITDWMNRHGENRQLQGLLQRLQQH